MFIVAKRSPILTTAEDLLCLFYVVVFVVFRMNVCFCCVRFSFFGTSQGILLEELFGNDVSCVVGRKTLTQSVIWHWTIDLDLADSIPSRSTVTQRP